MGLEHPDVSCALRTGYPSGAVLVERCCRCGEPAGWIDHSSNYSFCRECAFELADERRNEAVRSLTNEARGLVMLDGSDLLEWAEFEVAT